jgi:hypothetical protein
LIQWEKIKQDFPIFNTEKNRNLTYLDSAASSQKPKKVMDAVANFYENYYSNVHRGIYSLSETATDMYEKSRENVSKFIGSTSSASYNKFSYLEFNVYGFIANADPYLFHVFPFSGLFLFPESFWYFKWPIVMPY